MSSRLIIPDPAFWAGAARRLASVPAPPMLVAIPIRNEAARIAACLQALAAQVDVEGRPLPIHSFGIVLLLNNCQDDTADVIARVALRMPVWIITQDLPSNYAHAGVARRLAMDAAAGWLTAGGQEAGAILTTDADTRVAPEWIVRHKAAFAEGLDGVAGYVLADPIERAALPSVLRRRERLETRYGALLTEIGARLDPEPHDPWPRHMMAAGASLGITRAAYEAIGGLPLRPSGEDRALVAGLRARDARVRHDPAVRVITSCRLVGRAAGGMADTLQRRLIEPGAFCDDALEPVLDALHRNFWQASLRRLHRERWPSMDWAETLGIAETVASNLCSLKHFGAFWQAVERASPSLYRQRLRPSDLPVEILRARGVLGWLRTQPAALIDLSASLRQPAVA